VAFLAVRIPNTTAITSLELRVGNDASNYWSITQTQGFLGAWKTGEWTLLAFDLSTATTVGTVTTTAIDYIQILVNYDGTAITNFYTGYLWISLPSPWELIYGTAAIFKAIGSTPSQTISLDTDEVILNDAAWSIFEYQASKVVALQMGGKLSDPVIAMINEVLYGRPNDPRNIGLLTMYRADNPSQEIRLVGNWYDE
jgi:hypothetical protein